MTSVVLRVSQVDRAELAALLNRFDLELHIQPDDCVIAGSYWGDSEAGLQGRKLLARGDTPVHSVLHEAGHAACMAPARRAALDTNAGGDYDEENAVCYLQILLADELTFMSGTRMCNDMDAWGYTFRLGSARRWFAEDASDAHAWLQQYGLIDGESKVTWRCRGAA